MIYGEIKDLNQYKGISKNLDRAIEYILNEEHKKGIPGKNIIDGDNLYFNYPDCAITKEAKEGFFEGHKKYIDIHIVISGEENLGYTPRSEVKVKKEYDSEGDYELYEGTLKNIFHVTEDRFIMFFPDEPHMALLKVEEIKKITKVIFKVLV
ncbi:NanQ anomerase/TabA/YiaL family protein [Fusobacterium sp. THCT1E2]